MSRGSHLALVALASAAMPTCGWLARDATPSSDESSAAPSWETPAAFSPPQISNAPPEVQRWVADHAIPLTTVEAGHGFDDMQPLHAVIGDARVVALGEATHGTREFFQLKHRMLEFLVEQKGFTLFGIEATMPEAFEINEYVLHGKGDPRKALAHLYFWTWNTEEVLAMIEWMREYNMDASHREKVEFYGFDMQSPSYAAGVVLDYLGEVDAAQAKEFERKLALLLDPFELARDARGSSARRDQASAATRALLQRLESHRSAYVARAGSDAYEIATRHARIIADALRLRSTDPTFAGDERRGFRDRSMAENVEWILNRNPRRKMVLWAHNAHVGDGLDTTMGGDLRTALGSAMVVFGFALYRGEYRARNYDSPSCEVRTFTIQPSSPDSLDALLASSSLPVLALDLRETGADPEVAEWFAEIRETQSIGSGSSLAHGESSWFEHAKDKYDALLFVEHTTAARGTSSGISPVIELHLEPTNGGFELIDAEGVPIAWDLPPQLAEFDVDLVTDDPAAHRGQRSATLRKRRAHHLPVNWHASISQALDPERFRGKRVRVGAWVRADVRGPREHAYLWVRPGAPGSGVLTSIGDGARPISSKRWKREEIELVVPKDAISLSYGIALSGEGEVSIDDVEIVVLP